MNPDEILDKGDEDEWLREFLKYSNTATTAKMNQSRVASEVFFARTIAQSTSRLDATMIDLNSRLVAAFSDHAKALNKSANAANEHARSLKVATWALVLATIGLVVTSWLS